MTTPIIRREIAYIKTQTAEGTPVSSLVAADAVRCYDTSFAYEGLKSVERMTAGGTMGRVGNVYGGTHGKFGMSFEVSGGGEDMPAEHAAIFLAAGMTETIDSTAHTTKYALTSQKTLPVSVLFNQAGWRRRLSDCRPMSLSIAGVSGETLRATTELSGLIQAGNDTAGTDAVPDYPSTLPLVCRGAVVTITKDGSPVTSGRIESFNLDFQLSTITPPDISATHAFARPIITDRAPIITINPEFDLAADFHGDMSDNTPYAVEILYSAFTTATNRLRITAPACYITAIGDGDRSGIRTRELTLQCAKTGAGDNEVALTFETGA